MAGSDYDLVDYRFGTDGGSISWQGACNHASLTGWVKATQAIISISVFCDKMTPPSAAFNLRWRNATDSGIFATLVTGSGELRAGISAGAITNGDPVGTSNRCQT